MPSCPPADTLSRLLMDSLDGAELADVENHVEQCRPCQETLHRLARLADGPHTELMQRWEREAVEAAIPGDADRFLQELSHSSFAATRLAAPDEPEDDWDAWPRVDGYEIIGELGRGGMGVVYRARHVALDRPVALKMVLAGPVLNPQARRRFQHEARAVARLQHANVVQVYDVGEQGHRPFLAMELVDGGTLARRLAGHPRPPVSSARLVEALARGVQYAHDHGVVHRDLKPANVLVAGDLAADPPPVKITDFGLAKDLLAGATPLTQSGALLGTPSYMAPEQARGTGEAVGPPADVYALGAILYELLTGRPPFRAATPLDTLVQVVHTEPVAVNRLQPTVPRDLSTICLKCLEKEPGRRYLRAVDLADDLHRFLNNEPIIARPVGPLGRMRRWSRRNPALAWLLTSMAGLAAVALGIVLWQWQEAVDARGRADTLAVSEAMAHAAAQQQRDAAEEARRRAERAAVGLVIDRGVSLCERGETTAGLLWLARGLDQAAATGADDLEYALRANIAAWAGRTLVPRESPAQGASITSVEFLPGGRLLTGRWANKWAKPGPGEAQVWDPDGWRPIGAAFADPDPVMAAACSPDGARVLTASSTGTLRLWDRETGRPIGDPLPSAGVVTAMAFSPDGRRFVTGGAGNGRGGEARLWDGETGRPIDPPLPHPGRVNAVTFTPDGSTIVTGCGVTDDAGAVVGGEVRSWAAADGSARGRPLAHADAVTAVAVSPDGRLILTGCADRLARLWDRQTGRPVGVPRQHPFPIEAAAFGPDGKTVFTGGGSSRFGGVRGPAGSQFGVLVWDAATGKPLTGTLDHPDAVHALAVRPDGRLLATACRDGRIRLYECGDLRPLLDQRQTVSVVGVVFSPDGKYLLTGGGRPDGGAARLWDLSTGGPVGEPIGHTRPVCALSFARDGRTCLSASLDGMVQLRDVATGEPVGPPVRDDEPVTDVIVSADFRLVAALGVDGAVEVREVATGRPAGPTLTHPGRIVAAAFDPAGRVLATCAHDGPARLWDVASGQLVAPPLDHDGKEVTAVAFSPDGRTVLTGGRDGLIRAWEAGRPTVPPRNQGATPYAIEFSPDGKRFLTVSGDYSRTWGQVQLWDAATVTPLGPPLPQQVAVSAVTFHPGGRLVAAGGRDGDVRLWDVANGRPVGPPLYNAGPTRAVAFDAAGRRLAAAGDDGTIRVWAVPAPVTGTAADVQRWITALTGRRLDAGGAIESAEDADRRRTTASPNSDH